MRASGLLSSFWAYPANGNPKVTSDLGPSHSDLAARARGRSTAILLVLTR